MNKQLEFDMLNLDALLEKVKLQGLDYLKNLNERQTSVNVIKFGSAKLNEIGLGGLKTLELFNDKYEKIIVGSTGPRYLGYVIGGSTPASIIGDWLATIYDQNPQSINSQGDISAIIEKETIKLLLDLFNLPNDFLGGFVTGATMSSIALIKVINNDYKTFNSSLKGD